LNERVVQQERQPIALSWYRPRLSIVGWAIDARVNGRAGGVYVDIDGKLYPAFYGTERKDVADFFKTPAYRYCGFVRSISDLGEGSHRLSLAILTADRKAVYKSAESIQFEVKELGKWQQCGAPAVKRAVAPNHARAVRIHMIRNLFPHWADHSGAHQFTRYLDNRQYRFEEQVIPLGSDQFPVPISSLRDGLRRWVKKNGVHYYDLNNLRAELKAVRRCLQGSLDLVHCLDGEYMQYLPLFSKRVHHVLRLPRMVATFHQPPEILGRVLNKEIVRLLDHVCVYSRLQAGFFEQFMPASKISLVPHGVDTEFFRPGKREADGPFRCLTVGFWLRDLAVIWQTAEQLSVYPDIEFHLVTPHDEPPARLTNVKIHKNLDDAGLLKMYQRSDLLCLPLQDSAANNSLLEAAACGLPIVSSRVGGVPEYTNDNFARLLSPGNADAFASAILHLRAHAHERKQMGQAARRFAEENLAWQNVALRMAEVYDRLLRARS
jgi:glycosyltransferase involved in cell wall biosynthesis